MTPERVTWGFTQVPVSDGVFERLELIYREHRG